MPAILTLLGMRFYYWSREHELIHVQVEKDNREYMIELGDYFSKTNG